MITAKWLVLIQRNNENIQRTHIVVCKEKYIEVENGLASMCLFCGLNRTFSSEIDCVDKKGVYMEIVQRYMRYTMTSFVFMKPSLILIFLWHNNLFSVHMHTHYLQKIIAKIWITVLHLTTSVSFGGYKSCGQLWILNNKYPIQINKGFCNNEWWKKYDWSISFTVLMDSFIDNKMPRGVLRFRFMVNAWNWNMVI